MGQKHVKFELNTSQADLSEEFLRLRIRDQLFEHPKSKKKHFSIIDTEGTIPYPSSLSEVYEDSEDLPCRKVRIRKTVPKTLIRRTKKFKQKIKEFEFQEYLQSKRFKENHVQFLNAPRLKPSKAFKQKVKEFDKNESKISLLLINHKKKKLTADLSLSVKYKHGRVLTTVSTVRSLKNCYYTEDW